MSERRRKAIDDLYAVFVPDVVLEAEVEAILARIVAIDCAALTEAPPRASGEGLRAALARAIEGGYADESIDADLYQNDPVYHAVVWEVRKHRAALADDAKATEP